MSEKVISEARYLREFETILARLSDIVRKENNALRQGDILALKGLQEDKARQSLYLQRLWGGYKTTLNAGAEGRVKTFSSLNDRLDSFKALMKENAVLLTAAKVVSAERIEAGMTAWKRHQDEVSPTYGTDARTDRLRGAPSVGRSQLI